MFDTFLGRSAGSVVSFTQTEACHHRNLINKDKFEIRKNSVTQPPTTVPAKPKPEPNEEIPKTTLKPQEINTEKVQKQDTGSSLYIIISIIVIVILLCVLYYATKRCACCRNKEPRNSEILAEEGQALMKNDENKMKDETNDEVNEDSKSNEEPNTEGTLVNIVFFY